MEKRFAEIEFGYADAKEEGSEMPNLLVNGYLDEMGAVDAALHSNKFLFLGYKGSGKTSLLEHLRLTLNTEKDFVLDIPLREFSYKSLLKIVEGQNEQDSKFPQAWELILLIFSLHLLDLDNGKLISDESQFLNTIHTLKNIGLFPIDSIAQVVQKTANRKFKTNLANLLSIESESDSKRSIESVPFLIRYLKDIIRNVKSESKYLMLIDGLDDILRDTEMQYKGVMALINQAKSMNLFFKQCNLDFKIIIFCRTDIFDRLPDPNKNKLRQDCAFYFRWFDESETEAAHASNLALLANLRCRLKYPDVDDVFKEFFPAIFEGGDTLKQLLDYTRHIPRDFLQLLKSIQKYANNKGLINPTGISKGIKHYAGDYFLPELKDELAGYCDDTTIDDFFNVLSRVRKKQFHMGDLKRAAAEIEKQNLDMNKICEILFDCSALGNVMDDCKYFKYRNPNRKFSPLDPIILHNALDRANRQ